MNKPQPKKHRQQPMKLDMSFDEAMKKIVKAKVPRQAKKKPGKKK